MGDDRRLRIGINGFGRIGRALARVGLRHSLFDLCAVNDVNPDVSNLAYLLQYDSIYGPLDERVTSFASEGLAGLSVDGWKAAVHCRSRIDDVPWSQHGAEVVVDASGVLENAVRAERCLGGSVRSVILTQAPEEIEPVIIFGVNEERYDPLRHHVLSAGLCDANAVAPTLKALDEEFGIEQGSVTTVHPWLSYQNLLDGPSYSSAYPGRVWHHYPLGRSSAGSVIPKPTTVMELTSRVLPRLRGRLLSFSYRVPTMSVSSADITLVLKRAVEQSTVNLLFAGLAERPGPTVFKYVDEPLVSCDFTRSDASAVFDARWTAVQGRTLKVVLWYDNEWGYARRVADLARLVRRGSGDHAPR